MYTKWDNRYNNSIASFLHMSTTQKLFRKTTDLSINLRTSIFLKSQRLATKKTARFYSVRLGNNNNN